MKKETYLISSISCKTLEDGSISIMPNHEKGEFNLEKNSQLKIIDEKNNQKILSIEDGHISVNKDEINLFLV